MENKIKAIIVDFDGTLYNSNERQKRCFPPGGRKDWKRWNDEAETDPPNSWCVQIVHAMRAAGTFPVFVSGRENAFREASVRWLKRNLNLVEGRDYELFMRTTNDSRKDSIIKSEIYHGHIEPKYDIQFCVDDRQQVVDMWRSLGLTCLQCAPGNF